jgi:hypothetical protein
MDMKGVNFVYCLRLIFFIALSLRFANRVEQHNRIEAATEGNRNSFSGLRTWQ